MKLKRNEFQYLKRLEEIKLLLIMDNGCLVSLYPLGRRYFAPDPEEKSCPNGKI